MAGFIGFPGRCKPTTIGAETTAPNGLSGVEEVAVGGAFSCPRIGGGNGRCGGANESGQLGDGTKDDRLLGVTPVRLQGVRAIAAGTTHACASGDGAVVFC